MTSFLLIFKKNWLCVCVCVCETKEKINKIKKRIAFNIVGLSVTYLIYVAPNVTILFAL